VFGLGGIKAIKGINDVLAVNAEVQRRTHLVVPAIVLAEHQFQMRRKYWLKYQSDLWRDFCTDNRVIIAAFDAEDGHNHPLVLGQHFSTDDDWSGIKRGVLQRAGWTPNTGAKEPTTADWFIASQAAWRRWVLVVLDQGSEFSWYEHRTSLANLTAALREATRA